MVIISRLCLKSNKCNKCNKCIKCNKCRYSSVVEHRTGNAEVLGSIPNSGFMIYNIFFILQILIIF